MKIKTATTSHSKDMHRIHTNAVLVACKDHYSKNELQAWLADRSPERYHKGINRGEMYIAEDSGKVVGFGHAITNEIAAIYVDPVFHKKGIGKLLLEYGLEMISKNQQRIKVDSSLNAEGFYKKHGFVKIKDGVHIRRNVDIPIVVMEYLSPHSLQ